jgi:hypothetical protein
MVQEIYPGKWDELEEIDKKFNELEKRLGYPTETKRRLRPLFGSLIFNSIIIEYTWPSMGKLERTMVKGALDPEMQKLSEELDTIVKTQTTEIYTPVINIKDLQKE